MNKRLQRVFNERDRRRRLASALNKVQNRPTYTEPLKLKLTPDLLRRLLAHSEEGCAWPLCGSKPKSDNQWHLCPVHLWRVSSILSGQEQRRQKAIQKLSGSAHLGTDGRG